MQLSCWKCGRTIEITAAAGRIGRRDTCPGCDRDLKCCLNCRFYDPGKHNQCAETQAEWVGDKEAANYCDYFSPRPAPGSTSNRPLSPSENAKKKFGSLFKI